MQRNKELYIVMSIIKYNYTDDTFLHYPFLYCSLYFTWPERRTNESANENHEGANYTAYPLSEARYRLYI